MPLDLNEVPTEDLVEAIVTRNDAVVVVSTRGDDIHCFLNGSGLLCDGLLSYAQRELTLAALKRENE